MSESRLLRIYPRARLICSFWLPLKLQSRANKRWHWTKTKEVNRSEREVTEYVLRSNPRRVNPIRDSLACAVLGNGKVLAVLDRQGPRALDSDNLQGSAKAVRDQIAAHLGIDDRDPRVEWEVIQTNGKGVRYSVEVSFYDAE